MMLYIDVRCALRNHSFPFYRFPLKTGMARDAQDLGSLREEPPLPIASTEPAKSTVLTGQPKRFLRVVAWISFVLNVVIIATGGAVRLTGSGLGCTEWPLCMPGSLTPTPEMGIHGIIEFGNRTISGPLLIAAVLVVVLTWRIRRQRTELFVLSLLVLVLVLVQAVVGGVVVWEGLQATLVGFHYTVSLIIVCITAAYLVRMYEPAGPRERAVPKGYVTLTLLTTVAMAMLIFMGVLTTGAGPHSGDADVVRDGFDATLLSHLHAWPGYVTFALLVSLVVWAFARRLRPLRWSLTVLALVCVQIAVGIYQSRTGLPPLLVGVHMVLASLSAAAMTVLVLRLKQPKI